MGGIIGRLFREFAVTIAMCIAVSAFVALTLTPMMASRFLRNERETRHGRFYAMTERGFERLLGAYERGLDLVLRHQFATLCVFLATVAAHRLSVRQHPQGLLPAAGHRPDHRHLRGGAGRVVRRDEAPAGGARRDHRQGPGGCHLCHGARRRRLHARRINNGRFFITLKPHERARRLGLRGDRPAAAAAREGGGRAALPAGRAGRQRRRPGRRARSSSTRCRTPTSTS